MKVRTKRKREKNLKSKKSELINLKQFANKYYSNESNITFNKIKSIIKQHKSCLNTEQINDILISNYDNEEDINININNYFVIMRRIWGACPPTSRIKYILKWIKIGNDIPLWPPIY